MPTDLIHRIGIAVPVEKIYRTIATEEGIRACGGRLMCRIPTGFHPSAQGWRGATTLGQRSNNSSTPTGLYHRSTAI